MVIASVSGNNQGTLNCNQSLISVNSEVIIGESERKIYLEKEANKDKRKFPFEKYGVMVTFYLLMIFVNLMKGTSKFKSLVNIEK
jgi:hypothetical protein